MVYMEPANGRRGLIGCKGATQNRRHTMKTLLATPAVFALAGTIGISQASAQSHRSNRRETFRHAERVEKKQASGHYVTVEEQVWVPGYYKTEHQDVWIEGHYDIVKEARTDCHGC